MAAFVFGYGSLAAAGGAPARLSGHRRVWGVAMDNRWDLPGYKYYTDAAGRRPAVFVAFLDIVVDGGCPGVDGACLPVTGADLAALDERERNYERIDVTDLVEGVGSGRVWAYRGSVEGRARLAQGRRLGSAVVDAAYLRACPATPDPDGLPVVELVRHELP